MSKRRSKPSPSAPQRGGSRDGQAGGRRFLLVRFGGQGDALFLTPVAAALARLGWEVHVATNDAGLGMLRHNPYIAQLHPLRRDAILPSVPGLPNHPADLIEWRGALLPVEAVYAYFPGTGPEYGPWAVCNYRYVIESNSLHPWIHHGQNSTMINTYDMHLAWAGIDPQSLTPEQRRPIYRVAPQEAQALDTVIDALPRPLYLLQPLASSAARSYHRPRELYARMMRATQGTVLVWNGTNWETRGTPFPLPVAPGSTPMRASAALIARADLLVSSDTAVAHIAEAVGTRHVTFYSTVPAWTRSRDYHLEITVDCSVPNGIDGRTCACGIIGRDCPRRAHAAWAGLSERQRGLLRLLPPETQAQMQMPTGAPPDTGGLMPTEYYGVTQDGLQAEIEAARASLEAARQQLAFCTENLDLWPHVEPIMTEIERAYASSRKHRQQHKEGAR